MIVNYTDQAKQSKEGLALLETATRRLAEIIGSRGEQVTAEWDAVNNGQLSYKLKLRDEFGEVEISLPPLELQIPGAMSSRMSQVWRKLLKIEQDLVHEKLMQMVKEL